MRRELIAAILACGLPTSAQGEDALQPAMQGYVALYDLAGNPIEKTAPRTPFRIDVTIVNAAGSEAPAGLVLAGWLRPVSVRNMSCKEAARAYHATQRLPIGTVDLNGAAVGVLMEDGTVTIVDPDFSLASANLIGASTFPVPPSALTADPFGNRFLAVIEHTGEVYAVPVQGGERTLLVDGLDRPGDVFPQRDGSIWIHETGADRLSLVIEQTIEHSIPALGATRTEDGAHLLVRTADSVVLIETETDELPVKIASGAPLDAVVLPGRNGPVGVAILTGAHVGIHYLDAVDTPTEIALTDAAARLVLDPTGRFLFAFRPDGNAISAIDVAKGHVAQVIGSNPPVVDIAFVGRAAFLMTADQSLLGAIDLASIKRGAEPKVREIALGKAREKWRGGPGMMTTLYPEDVMLAVHAESFTAFPIHDNSLMGDAPPMSAITLRGGVPLAVASLDRGFEEVAPGRFQTTSQLPEDRAYELVVTTGIGDLSFCATVSGAGDVAATGPGTISAIERQRLTYLKFQDADGNPIRFRGDLTFSSLIGGWRRHARIEADDDGLTRQGFDLPPAGPIVVTAQPFRNQEFHPLLLGD